MFVVVNFEALAGDFQIERSESPADWMPADKPTELSRIKLKNSTARPYDQRVFSPLDPTAIWLPHLDLAIYMFVVVNFDALAQATDFQIERREVVVLCWMQDLNQGFWNRISSRLNAHWQTDCTIENQAKKTWNQQPVPMISEHSAHSTHLPFGCRTCIWRYTRLLLSISILWHRQAIFKSKGDKLSSSAECRTWTRVYRKCIWKNRLHNGVSFV